MLARIYGTAGYDILKTKSQFVGTQIYFEPIINSLIMNKVTYLLKFGIIVCKIHENNAYVTRLFGDHFKIGTIIKSSLLFGKFSFYIFFPFPYNLPIHCQAICHRPVRAPKAKGTVWFFGFFILKDSHA